MAEDRPLKVSPTIEVSFLAKEPLGLVLDDNFEGVQVATVSGNARARGVEPGDVITHVNGEPFPVDFRSHHFAALIQTIRESAPLSSISLDVLRVRVTVVDFPPAPRGKLGLAFDDSKGARETPGLIVSRTYGAAKSQGIEPGDLVLTINNEVIPPNFPPLRFVEVLNGVPGAVHLIVVRTGRPFPRGIPRGAVGLSGGKPTSPVAKWLVELMFKSQAPPPPPKPYKPKSGPVVKDILSSLTGEMANVIGVFAEKVEESKKSQPPKKDANIEHPTRNQFATSEFSNTSYRL